MISALRSFSRVAWLIVLGMVILFIDFLSKAYVYYQMPSFEVCPTFHDEQIIFRNFLGIEFAINLVINRGAAWGLFSDFQVLLLCIRFLVVIGMIIYLLFINQNPLIDIPLVLIIAGAVGNIIDFFLYGFVIDFLRFNLWGYHFPVFNLADVSITIGVIWLLLIAAFSKNQVTIT